MDVASLGEKLGRKLINPKSRVGFVVATVVAGGILLIGGGDVVTNPQPGQCETHPLRNVYRSFRLRVVDTCVTETVTVVEARRERDGDYHVGVIPESEGLINDINRARQHGLLLVGWVPGDPRPSVFRTGMRLKVTGTLVEDLQHGPAAPTCPRAQWATGCKRGWRELHPVFDVEEILDRGLAPVQKASPIPGEAEQEDR